MIGKIVGALIGAEVERRRQESGLKGAIIGAAAVGLGKRIVPLALVVGGAYAAKKFYDSRSTAAATA